MPWHKTSQKYDQKWQWGWKICLQVGLKKLKCGEEVQFFLSVVSESAERVIIFRFATHTVKYFHVMFISIHSILAWAACCVNYSNFFFETYLRIPFEVTRQRNIIIIIFSPDYVKLEIFPSTPDTMSECCSTVVEEHWSTTLCKFSPCVFCHPFDWLCS